MLGQHYSPPVGTIGGRSGASEKRSALTVFTFQGTPLQVRPGESVVCHLLPSVFASDNHSAPMCLTYPRPLCRRQDQGTKEGPGELDNFVSDPVDCEDKPRAGRMDVASRRPSREGLLKAGLGGVARKGWRRHLSYVGFPWSRPSREASSSSPPRVRRVAGVKTELMRHGVT